MRTLHGMHSRGFPNCFIMGPQQAGFTANFPHLLDEESRHIAYIVAHCARARRAHRRGVARRPSRRGSRRSIRLAGMGREFLEACTPGYYNNEGKLSDVAAQNGFYGGGSIEFFRLLREWREKGGLEGLELA